MMKRRDLLGLLPFLGIAVVAPNLALGKTKGTTVVKTRVQPVRDGGFFVAKYTYYPWKSAVKSEYLRADGTWLEVPENHVLPEEVLLWP